MSKAAIKYLTSVKNLIGKKSAWTQKAFARESAKGRALTTGEDWGNAKCFCLVGAMYNFKGTVPENVMREAHDALLFVVSNEYGEQDVSWFNDAKETTFEMVHEAIDKALERLK